MEILGIIFHFIPLVFLVVYVISATLTDDDIKEIKYLLWAMLFIAVAIADAVVNG